MPGETQAALLLTKERKTMRTIKTKYTKTNDGKGSRMMAYSFYNGECIQYAPKKRVLVQGYNHAKSLEENHDSIFNLICHEEQRAGCIMADSPSGKWVKGQCNLLERVYIKYEHERRGLGPKPDLLEVEL